MRTGRALVALALGGALAGCTAAALSGPPPAPHEQLRDVRVIDVTDSDGSTRQMTTGCYGATRLFFRVGNYGVSIAAVGADPTCTAAVVR